MQEVGLRAEEKEEEIVEYPEEEHEKPVFKEQTKYCSNCGSAIDEKAEICPKCGARVSELQVLENKNVALAAVLSFVIPGIGQMYCGKMKRGVAILVLSIFMFFIFGATAASAGANSSEPLFPFLMWILFYIWNIYDAYKLAEKINRREA